MERVQRITRENIEAVREGLTGNPNIYYYHESAEFTSSYTLKVGDKTLYSKMIFLCTGSKPAIPPVKGLEAAGYLTSDTVLQLNECLRSLVIFG
jgi:dihydrolipoamide dehydrogenase